MPTCDRGLRVLCEWLEGFLQKSGRGAQRRSGYSRQNRPRTLETISSCDPGLIGSAWGASKTFHRSRSRRSFNPSKASKCEGVIPSALAPEFDALSGREGSGVGSKHPRSLKTRPSSPSSPVALSYGGARYRRLIPALSGGVRTASYARIYRKQIALSALSLCRRPDDLHIERHRQHAIMVNPQVSWLVS